MAEFAALPLFTDALLADTGHLTHEEFGRYMRLLILMWRSPDGKLPNQRDWLCKRLNCGTLEYGEKIEPIVKEFCQSDGNFITQKRLLKELAYVRKHSTKQRANANARWGNENAKKRDEKRDIESVPHKPMEQLDLGTCQTDAPSPTPTPTIKRDKAIALSIPAFELPNWVDPQDWKDFSEMRRRIRKPMTDRAAKAIIKKLENYRNQGHEPATILEQSIRNSWQDVYAPKLDDQNRQHQNPKASYLDKVHRAADGALALIKARREADRGMPWDDEQPALTGGNSGYLPERPVIEHDRAEPETRDDEP